MNDFFNRLFGKSFQTSVLHRHDNPISVQDESDHAKRDQLVQMLLHALMRKHGIPAHWIDLHILVVPGQKRGLAMYLHLIVRQWDARLMNHAQAFQDRLMADINQYEPKCSEWLHGVSWQLEMSSTCPYTTLPEKAFWKAPAQPVAAQAAPVVAVAATAAPIAPVAPMAPVAPAASLAPGVPVSPVASAAPAPARSRLEEHAHLERLFAIRDQEISKKGDWDDPPGFEDTQPLDDDEEEDAKARSDERLGRLNG